MPLAKDTTYTNVFYDHVIKVLQSKIQDEFQSIPVYVAPVYVPVGNFSIKIWGDSASTESMLVDQWTKSYRVNISMYHVTQNPDEKFWEHLYQYSERLYELLQNNYNLSGSFGWRDGKVDEIGYLEYSDLEDETENLYPVKMSFSCLISRSQ